MKGCIASWCNYDELGKPKMMRIEDIKFRGRRIDNGEWIEGALLNFENPQFNVSFPAIMAITYDNNMTGFATKSVDVNTIRQFTGFKDSQQVDIWSGDILLLECFGCSGYVTVEWNEGIGAWCIRIDGVLGNKTLGEWLTSNSFMVVGNIYDNPELLETIDDGK